MATTTFLSPANSFLHVIDIQASLMARIHNSEAVTTTVALLLQCSEILGLPVIANTQYKKGLGPYSDALQEAVAKVPCVDKTEFNALANEQTAAVLDELPAAVTKMILVGVETHICICQTALAALDRGITPYIVSDGVSSRHPDFHKSALQRLAAAGAVVGPAEMFVYELLGKAGTPQFKEILPLIVARDKHRESVQREKV